MVYAQYFDAVKRVMEKGHAVPQLFLGVMYANAARNDTEAVRWYRLAAAQGSSQAQYNLGVMYAKGRGVAKNKAEALEWFHLAEENGHRGAKDTVKAYYKARYPWP